MKIFIFLQMENAPLRVEKGKKRWGLGTDFFIFPLIHFGVASMMT